jgi:hypothetical protein
MHPPGISKGIKDSGKFNAFHRREARITKGPVPTGMQCQCQLGVDLVICLYLQGISIAPACIPVRRQNECQIFRRDSLCHGPGGRPVAGLREMNCRAALAPVCASGSHRAKQGLARPCVCPLSRGFSSTPIHKQQRHPIAVLRPTRSACSPDVCSAEANPVPTVSARLFACGDIVEAPEKTPRKPSSRGAKRRGHSEIPEI